MNDRVMEMRAMLMEVAEKSSQAPQCLQGRFYVNPDFFEYEKQTLLKDGWHCVGRVDELPDIGSYFTRRLFHEPLILVRDKEGIRALSNVCRHRGMRVASGSGKARTGSGYTEYFANYPDDIPSRGTGAEELSEEARARSTLYGIYPCHVFSIAASLLVSLSIHPLTSSSIEVRWTMSVYKHNLDEKNIHQSISM
jgi:hypothetical protein